MIGMECHDRWSLYLEPSPLSQDDLTVKPGDQYRKPWLPFSRLQGAALPVMSL